jgi:hypothetical protein
LSDTIDPYHFSKLVFLEFLDPEYLEFLELISKPTEHLPSAEIQLERKEAERAGRICHHYFLSII